MQVYVKRGGKTISSFKDERLKELIDLVDKAAKDGTCKFEYYMNDNVRPLPIMINQNIEKVLTILEEIKQKYDFTCEIKNTRKMRPEELKRAYAFCAHWSSSPPKRDYRISRSVYSTFEAGEAGSWFGREIPALVATRSSGRILFALPHRVIEKKFSLIDHVQKGEGSYLLEGTLTVYDFLTALKAWKESIGRAAE